MVPSWESSGSVTQTVSPFEPQTTSIASKENYGGMTPQVTKFVKELNKNTKKNKYEKEIRRRRR